MGAAFDSDGLAVDAGFQGCGDAFGLGVVALHQGPDLADGHARAEVDQAYQEIVGFEALEALPDGGFGGHLQTLHVARASLKAGCTRRR